MNKLILKLLLPLLMVSLSAQKIQMLDILNEEQYIHEEQIVAVQIEYAVPVNAAVVVLVDDNVEDDYEKVSKELSEKIESINEITDKKEWFISYKKIIDEYGESLDSPETIYDLFTDEELDLLFRVVQAEIGDEYTFEQKANVASVIFNRMDHEEFPDTLSEILIPSQFSTISNGRYKNIEVSETTILACEYAFSIEDTTGGCLFFDSNNKLRYEFVWNDGAHNFYKLKNE